MGKKPGVPDGTGPYKGSGPGTGKKKGQKKPK